MSINITLVKFKDAEAFGKIMAIRMQVFVTEQNVPADEEQDIYDTTATHLLAEIDNKPAGCARFRKTETGFKLERFAVYVQYRKSGVGSALLKKVLALVTEANINRQTVYLHAQEGAVVFYQKFGFVKVGAPFYEANIKHYKMVLNHTISELKLQEK